MPKQIKEEDNATILAAIALHPEGARRSEIEKSLPEGFSPRTLQFRLRNLVNAGRLVTVGEGRALKYRLSGSTSPAVGTRTEATPEDESAVPISAAGRELRLYLGKPLAARTPVSYKREFLDSYRPNERFYLSEDERASLASIGTQNVSEDAAGTYARRILNRLLIDLSWNSSRLEGNTYSLLDTRRLIEFGEVAEGRDRREAQMIMNHKDAIEFLVNAADEIGFNRYTVLNLHAILAHNLLADESAAGRLRYIPVGIERSVFHPLAVPQQIEECFAQILDTAAAIKDPFEQAFFAMVHLPYLQPFDDVNKSVSRLAANIPFIQHNLSPLSFTEVPGKLYTEAMLGIYERNDIALIKDVFLWAYQRSAEQYVALRQSLGEPDPFRFKHSGELRTVVAHVIRSQLNRRSALSFVASWSEANIATDEREPFREMAEKELLGLHEGNFARYQIRPTEFAAWQAIWSSRS